MQIQRKDFLERIIEEFAEVLANLAGLRKTRSHLAALELIDRTVGGIMGMNEDVVAMLSPNSLRGLIAMDPLLDDNYRLMLAECTRRPECWRRWADRPRRRPSGRWPMP